MHTPPESPESIRVVLRPPLGGGDREVTVACRRLDVPQVPLLSSAPLDGVEFRDGDRVTSLRTVYPPADEVTYVRRWGVWHRDLDTDGGGTPTDDEVRRRAPGRRPGRLRRTASRAAGVVAGRSGVPGAAGRIAAGCRGRGAVAGPARRAARDTGVGRGGVRGAAGAGGGSGAGGPRRAADAGRRPAEVLSNSFGFREHNAVPALRRVG